MVFGVLAAVVAAAGQTPELDGGLAKKWRSVRRALEDAEEKAIVVPTMATIDLEGLAAALDDAEDLIDVILDPAQSPSVDPSTAGSVDTSIDPQTLEAYATACVDLAWEVEDELSLGASYDPEYVGTRIRTIKHLLTRIDPHNYRSIAGL